MIGRELDDRGVTDWAAIGTALGTVAPETTKLLTRHQWRHGDAPLLEAATAQLGVRVQGDVTTAKAAQRSASATSSISPRSARRWTRLSTRRSAGPLLLGVKLKLKSVGIMRRCLSAWPARGSQRGWPMPSSAVEVYWAYCAFTICPRTSPLGFAAV
jgi:hypothetical protein